MGAHRLARPKRANLVGGVVANREDEIEHRGAGAGKFFPRFGTQAAGVVVETL